MSDLERFRDHCRERATWRAGTPRLACRDRTVFGTAKPPDHANCGGRDCGCSCHAPTARDRALFTALADEIDAYLAGDDEGPGLFEEDA